MVTHDRYFLDRVANRIVEVDHGNLYNYPGSYSEFVKLKEERQNMALATQRKRKSLLRTELEWLSRGARARSTKQKAHIDRIKAMQEMKDIQEERRLFYVGMTRAKDKLYLYYAKERYGQELSCSRFIEELRGDGTPKPGQGEKRRQTI